MWSCTENPMIYSTLQIWGPAVRLYPMVPPMKARLTGHSLGLNVFGGIASVRGHCFGNMETSAACWTLVVGPGVWSNSQTTLRLHQCTAKYMMVHAVSITLQWRHNERDGVSNHQPHDCLIDRLFRRRSKKISKLRVTGLCELGPL